MKVPYFLKAKILRERRWRAAKEFYIYFKKNSRLSRQRKKLYFLMNLQIFDRPSMFYGWAEKNTRPQIPSNEKRRRNKLNGMLAVDAHAGEEYFKLKEKSKTEDVSSYFAELASDCLEQGVKKLSVILDNNSTHKRKMQAQLQVHLSSLEMKDKILVEFIHTPPYSPNFNLAEYIIHLLRLQFLHHLPLGVNIQQIREKLENYFQNSQLQSSDQIQNTIRHICALVQ